MRRLLARTGTSLPNRALSLLLLILAGLALSRVGQWAITDAVWTAGPPSVCRDADGACWSIIREKWLLILFGRYPQDALWRPTVATLLLVTCAVLSGIPRFWGKSLAVMWVAAPLAFVALMHGGALGLRPVAPALWGGLPLTLMLAIFGVVYAFPIGVLLAIGRRSQMPVIAWLSVGYIEVVRGVPLITVLFLASFVFPLVLPAGFSVEALVRVQIAIILFTAAYMAEIVRGGLQSVPEHQFEAVTALGISRYGGYRHIILPQALSRVIPATVNTFIELFKDTSLVAIVSLSDLLLSTRQAIADPGWRMFFVEAYLFIALIYFVFCLGLSWWSRGLETRFGAERDVYP